MATTGEVGRPQRSEQVLQSGAGITPQTDGDGGPPADLLRLDVELDQRYFRPRQRVALRGYLTELAADGQEAVA